ncbi:hypothetical protein [Lactiplantibacillus mudanjiangensis]|uniref:Uncharacterized protein n=1 Tax=Lactiplantibacillus mudanjiangensis TaxID=1296538 RepID=A0A660EAS7_9LACO|nr:hypothetical protein [Lactiplantibacillus mudanjiangensis]VDG23712.1 hypothetical protein [Lactobacillus sakei] [Lactiplantibacillus mudanjiangensis]VDG29615.1 hypothetical protein [Lactobacillus sakei] [Lactiplantibacillus mudanjiangensis]
MSVSSWSSLITALTSIVAIIISVSALITTKKSIEDANRPYVQAYLKWMWFDQNLEEYLIIKNFGKTGANINSISFSDNWTNSFNNEPVFPDMKNVLIAPNQAFETQTELDAAGTGNGRNRKNPITMTIKYSWSNGYKSDTFRQTFSADTYKNFELVRTETGHDDFNKLFYRAVKEFLRTRL